MRLDEIRPHLVLEFDDSHECLCGRRVVMDDMDQDGSDELFVVCENGEAHPLSDLVCDADGTMEDGIEVASEQPNYAQGWIPNVQAIEERVMEQLKSIMDSGGDNSHVRRYLDEALFNLIMLRYTVAPHEHDAMTEQLLGMAIELAGTDQIH